MMKLLLASKGAGCTKNDYELKMTKAAAMRSYQSPASAFDGVGTLTHLYYALFQKSKTSAVWLPAYSISSQNINFLKKGKNHSF
jgi:hypothetical protein